jgi:putative PIN family toxin of toxin-antitoxin system
MQGIIMDTNVLFAALYSGRGASRQILKHLIDGRLRIVLSTPLLFEYEDVLQRNRELLGLSNPDIDVILDNLCDLGTYHKVYFLWRPCLPDAKDDLLLELAVASRVPTIVTHNIRDFKGSERFGVRAITPQHCLEELRHV